MDAVPHDIIVSLREENARLKTQVGHLEDTVDGWKKYGCRLRTALEQSVNIAHVGLVSGEQGS